MYRLELFAMHELGMRKHIMWKGGKKKQKTKSMVKYIHMIDFGN